MDSELIFYIIFLVIALLSRILKKKPEKPQGSNPPADGPGKPIKSFEELLEEFTGQDQQRPTAPDRTERRERARSQRDREMERRENEYTWDESFSFDDQEKLRTLDEQVEIENIRTTSRLQPVDEAEEDDSGEAADAMTLLEDPEDARKAIILSEILTRKY